MLAGSILFAAVTLTYFRTVKKRLEPESGPLSHLDLTRPLDYDQIGFLIGGPLGFADEVSKAADARLSLSQLTFPHELARIVFLEQLYRAFTILRGYKYHKA